MSGLRSLKGNADLVPHVHPIALADANPDWSLSAECGE